MWVEVEKEKSSKMKKLNLEKIRPIPGTEKSCRAGESTEGQGRDSQFMFTSFTKIVRENFKVPLLTERLHPLSRHPSQALDS